MRDLILKQLKAELTVLIWNRNLRMDPETEDRHVEKIQRLMREIHTMENEGK